MPNFGPTILSNGTLMVCAWAQNCYVQLNLAFNIFKPFKTFKHNGSLK